MFRRSSKRNDDPITVGRLDPSDGGPIKHSKTHSYDIQDPILTAIHDQEPFQMNANIQSNVATVSPDLQIRDIFGNVIAAPDRSNPTRPRDERPLDTVRAFEYLCTGDERLREEMETTRYGWNVRPNFANTSTLYPRYETNPYAPVTYNNNGEGEGAPPPVNMNTPFKTYDPNTTQTKKKRGFFSRKKKN